MFDIGTGSCPREGRIALGLWPRNNTTALRHTPVSISNILFIAYNTMSNTVI